MEYAGSRTLSIFTNALDVRVLYAHAEGPLRSCELEETLGWAPESSLRAAVSKMCDLSVLTRIELGGASPSAATELTTAGHELLPVANALERWLQSAPGGPIPLDDTAAHGMVRVLAAGWDSTVVRALAERPQTLVELSAEIGHLSYPALKRRLAKLRSTQLVVPVRTEQSMAYAASDWLRHAVVPLALAGRWERKHDAEAQPISRIEVEAAFLLAFSLVDSPGRTSGVCSLAVLISDDPARSQREVAGVCVEVEKGRIVACHAGATTQATWALGTTDAWLEAVIDGSRDALRISGAKPRLAENLVKALSAGLFRPGRP